MLDKLAQLSAVRESEVRGCLAAFVDSGIMKVASEEEFDALSSAVADNIGLDYDIDTIYKTAAYFMDDNQEKTAEEFDDTAYKAALGELLLMKTAGQIDDDTFASEYEALTKEAANAKVIVDKALGRAGVKDRIAGALSGVGSKVKKVVTAPYKNIGNAKKDFAAAKTLKDLGSAPAATRALQERGKKSLKKGLKQLGVQGAAVGGTGLAAGLYAKHSSK